MTESKFFLSHSGQDAVLSVSVQGTIERNFSARRRSITVFNTSTPHDRFETLESYISSGTLWSREVIAYEEELKQYLRHNLSESFAYLLLVTPLSLAADSKWIAFEIEMARSIALQGKTSFFFPCVAHGVALAQLPAVASEFQGLHLSDPAWVEQLTRAVTWH